MGLRTGARKIERQTTDWPRGRDQSTIPRNRRQGRSCYETITSLQLRSLESSERLHETPRAYGRLHKETFRDKHKMRVSVNSLIMPWITKHAAWIHNNYQQHQDGKTSCERRWRVQHSTHTSESGEAVLFRFAAAMPDKTTMQWNYGICLGKSTESDEHLIVTKQKVYRTTTARILPLQNKYDLKLLESIEGTPWATRGIGKAPTTYFVILTPLGRPSTNKAQQTTTKTQTTSTTEVDTYSPVMATVSDNEGLDQVGVATSCGTTKHTNYDTLDTVEQPKNKHKPRGASII